MSDKLTSLKNRCRTERGHFTRLEAALAKALDLAVEHDNDRATAELITVWEKFKKKTDTVSNSRLQRFRSQWKAGKTHLIVDAFSRAPISRPEDFDEEDSTLDRAHVSHLRDTTTQLDDFISAASEDDEYKSLIAHLKQGDTIKKIPTRHELEKATALI